MIRSLARSTVTVVLAADLATPQPELRVSDPAGAPRVEISMSQRRATKRCGGA